MAKLGVYVGNDTSEVRDFESWLGRRVDGVHSFIGQASWSDFVDSAKWATNLWDQIDRPVFWSVPLIVNGASLSSAAAGSYNSYYKQVAQELASNRPGDDEIYVRTGWEFNGDWFPWAAGGKEQAYIGAFRQLVNTFRSVSDRFEFEWNVNIGYGSGGTWMDPAKAYPGDSYVDVVGMDFYYFPQWDSSDPIAAWDSKVKAKYGLQWLENFAAAHKKPTAYSEWSVTTDKAGPYVEKAKAWFDGHNVAYHTYWDSNAAYPGKLSDNSDPNTGKAFKNAFSGPSETPLLTPDPTPSPDGDDTITVRIQGDGWNGDPNFRLIVDGKVIDSSNPVSADKRDGEWQTFTFKGAFDSSGTQAHRVGIQFNNDLYGGTESEDRNLYVDKVTFNGVVNDRDATFKWNETKYWEFNL